MSFAWFFLPLLFLLPAFLHLINKRKTLPPGPCGLPIVGNLLQLGSLPHHTLFELSKKYGDVMLLRFGFVPTLIISSSEAAKQILKTHDLKTCSRPVFTGIARLSYNYRDIGFTPYSPYWRDMRKLCAVELFSQKRVDSFRSVREEEVDSLIKTLAKLGPSSCVDLTEKTMRLSADVICRVAFGKGFQGRGFSNERFREIIREGFEMLGNFSSGDFFPYVGWIIDRVSGFHSRMEKVFREFDVFYDEVIEDHLSKGRNGREEDIIDVLLNHEKTQSQSSGGITFSRQNVKAILMNIFLAGVDTGAIVMVWTMAELVKNPEIMKKVQQEIRNHIGSKGKVTESDLNNLRYLKMVIKETLRMHPPGPLLVPRETMSQFTINGYEIYPKTRIQINVWAIARDPKVWENPGEFYPERFLDDESIEYTVQNNYEMLPFGGGKRGCPGASMGMALVELALANLLLRFDWELPKNMKSKDLNMDEAFGLATYKKEPLLLVPINYPLS